MKGDLTPITTEEPSFMAQTVVSIFDYRKNTQGDIFKSYSFDTEKDADDFAFAFNFAPQGGHAWARHSEDTPQAMKPFRAVVSGEVEQWDGTKIYIMHTIRVNHGRKRIVTDKVDMFTRQELEAKRQEFPESPIMKAFDGMMAHADIWDNPSKAFRVLEHGVPAKTPLEEPDVIATQTINNDLVTYISFLPNIRARISAAWDKTYLSHPGEEDERWIDMYHAYLCMDCNEDTSDLDEYYSISEELWREAVPEDKGMLCVGCLEKRAGRKLNHKDFPLNVPLNWCNVVDGSNRLIDRMTDSGNIVWDTQVCEIKNLATGETVRGFSEWVR